MAFLVFSSLVFADVGPSPSAPDITVTFTRGGEAYTGPITLTYHCYADVIGDDTGSPMADREVEFSCASGVCTNEQWFYKLNPCFFPDSGYFEYGIEGTYYVTAGDISFGESAYNIVINADTGETATTTSAISTDCWPIFVIMIVAGFVLLVRNKIWN